MKDKLSLEELKEWLRVLGSYCRAKTVYHGKTQRITTFKQAYSQIKAMLQPVPKEKLKEFMKAEVEILMAQSKLFKTPYDFEVYLWTFLKKHDKLKESSDE